MKLLYVTSLSGKRINSFMRSAVVAAKQCGIDFTMACNMTSADKELYQEDCSRYGIKTVHVDFDRNPLSLQNLKAKKQLKKLMKEERFDVVHCNTPIGGVLGRICAKEVKIPYVIYQAHGFHFWKGAPLKNWMLYYPVERLLARYTDLLITINEEDKRVAESFRLKKNGKLTKVHGVGVELEKIQKIDLNKSLKREKLGIESDAYVMVTVGELVPGKNQITTIRAFAKANIEKSYMLICGDGSYRKELEDEIVRLGMEGRVCCLGFRHDVLEILHASDVFVFSSFREGLPAALMEAMAVGLPCIASAIRGNVDLLGKDYKYLHEPLNVDELANMMCSMKQERETYSEICRKNIEKFDFEIVVKELSEIYHF